MSTAVVPSFTDNALLTGALASPVTLAFGAKTSGSVDLRTKYGGYLSLELGRRGATAPGTALTIAIYRIKGNDVAGAARTLHWSNLTSLTAGNTTTVAADAAAAQSVVVVASGTGIAAGDVHCIWDAANARLEFPAVSKVSGTTVTYRDLLQYTHTQGQADNVSRIADVYSDIWLPGGAIYHVFVDYGASGSGSDYVARASITTYDQDTIG